MEIELKKTRANTSIEVNCKCPYCDEYMDILSEVCESLDESSRAENCDIEIKCSECGEYFIVTDIDF